MNSGATSSLLRSIMAVQHSRSIHIWVLFFCFWVITSSALCYAEDDKHLTIISGLRAIKKSFLLKYLNRRDRCIMKLWRKISSLKRDCNQMYRLFFPLGSKFSPSHLDSMLKKSSLHVHPCQGCAFKMQIFCFSRDGSAELKVAKTKLWRELQGYQPIWIWSLCPCLISEILVWSINRIIIW